MLLVKTTIGPSRIHGTGLIAAEFIRKGTRIWEVTEGFDRKVPRSQVECLPEPQRLQMLRYSYTEISTGLLVICIDDDRYTNHSDTPNTREVHTRDALAYSVALRDIVPGEEITCDYWTFDASAEEKLGPRRVIKSKLPRTLVGTG